ncbi:hypothetical protein ACWC0A_06385 [Streptomyces scopuliridis]
MVTEQVSRMPEGADVMRADSLAREIHADVVGKWALLVINTLADRTLRFSEIEAARHRYDTRDGGRGGGMSR